MRNRLAKYYEPASYSPTFPTYPTSWAPFTSGGLSSILDLFLGHNYAKDPLQESVQNVGGSLVLSLAVPGFTQDEVEVQVVGRNLCFKAEKENTSWQRSWSLPQDAVIEEITAELKNGILSVTVPRKEEDIKKIDIQLN